MINLLPHEGTEYKRGGIPDWEKSLGSWDPQAQLHRTRGLFSPSGQVQWGEGCVCVWREQRAVALTQGGVGCVAVCEGQQADGLAEAKGMCWGNWVFQESARASYGGP